ncbi:hypothetical protein [Martelella sp. HB161492]|uniref:hypothetical protein n=1 Tax=Martelella sp. HB161492 TaxID=2720726 RepID=UPI0015911972|nr:hypothetical protein [Martelella sp. HB161492]
MTAGVEIRNESGILQLDQTYGVYKLVDARTIATDGSDSIVSGAAFYGSTFSYTVTAADSAIVCVRPVSGGACVNVVIAGNGDGTVTVSGAIGSGSQGAKTAALYLFDASPYTHSGDNFGLEVFDDQGRSVFHSSDRVLRLSQTFVSGRDMAILPVKPAVAVRDFAQQGLWYYWGAWYLTGDSSAPVSVYQYPVAPVAGSVSSASDPDVFYLLADVTNYL